MAMNYADAPSSQGGGELIPDGTLHWALFTVRPYNIDGGFIEKPSKSDPANAYIDAELTLIEGPFENRKVWDMIGVAGKPAYVSNGMAAIKHILEVGRRAGPENMNGYMIESFMELDQLKVAVEIKIEKGKDNYPDKNRIARYLSPNPTSDTHKKYALLLAGENMKPAASGAKAAPSIPAIAQKASTTQAGAKPTWL